MISIVDSIKHLAWAARIKWKMQRWLHTKHMEKFRDLLFSCQINYAVKEVATMPSLKFLCALSHSQPIIVTANVHQHCNYRSV